MPPVPAPGLPLSVAVPSWLSVKLTPDGSASPLRVIVVATGTALVVIAKLPTSPTLNVVLFGLVKVPLSLIVSVKLCDAGDPTPLVAVNVSGNDPREPLAGVPLSVAVPLPLSVNLISVGSTPLCVSVAVGVPVLMTVNDPATPAVKVTLAALVIAAGACTLSLKL